MRGNSIGQLFKLHTFGESHGAAIGGIIDGVPAGLQLDMEAIQVDLDRRKPGQSKITTQRKESDQVQFLSGIFEGKTTGTPIGFMILNEDQKSKDYSHVKDVYRPSHADYTYDQKFGDRDYRGGGRSSARETACRVVAGAIAKQVLKKEGVVIRAYVSQVEDIQLTIPAEQLDFSKTESNIVRCPDLDTATKMIERIEAVRKEGDTVGGVVSAFITGVPSGLGEPVFDKLHADLGKSMLSINAVKGFEYGSGFNAASMRGSAHNDIFEKENNQVTTRTNFSGGIQGGISNGSPIHFRVAFKPVATIMRNQSTIDKDGNQAEVQGKGRHDPCVVPRAVVIVEAMAAMVLVDHLLRNKTSKI
jgi:chorismate synthase